MVWRRFSFAVALGLSASLAEAETDAAFALERCVLPLIQATPFETAGLIETEAEALGLSPEGLFGQQPVMWHEAETGRILGVFETPLMQACVMMRGGPASHDDFTAVLTEHGFRAPEGCVYLETKPEARSSFYQSDLASPRGGFVRVIFNTTSEGTSTVIGFTNVKLTSNWSCEESA